VHHLCATCGGPGSAPVVHWPPIRRLIAMRGAL